MINRILVVGLVIGLALLGWFSLRASNDAPGGKSAVIDQPSGRVADEVSPAEREGADADASPTSVATAPVQAEGQTLGANDGSEVKVSPANESVSAEAPAADIAAALPANPVTAAGPTDTAQSVDATETARTDGATESAQTGGAATEAAEPESEGDAGSDSSAQLTEAPAQESLPRFDIVRVDADGQTVIAGKAAPGMKVEVLLDGSVVGEAITDEAGDFVSVIFADLTGQAQQLQLRTRAPPLPSATPQQTQTGNDLTAPTAEALTTPDPAETPAADDVSVKPVEPTVSAAPVAATAPTVPAAAPNVDLAAAPSKAGDRSQAEPDTAMASTEPPKTEPSSALSQTPLAEPDVQTEGAPALSAPATQSVATQPSMPQAQGGQDGGGAMQSAEAALDATQTRQRPFARPLLTTSETQAADTLVPSQPALPETGLHETASTGTQEAAAQSAATPTPEPGNPAPSDTASEVPNAPDASSAEAATPDLAEPTVSTALASLAPIGEAEDQGALPGTPQENAVNAPSGIGETSSLALPATGGAALPRLVVDGPTPSLQGSPRSEAASPAPTQQFVLSAPVIILPSSEPDAAPTLVQPKSDDLAILQPGGGAASGVVLDRITYGETGEVRLSGRARPDRTIRIYGNAEVLDTVRSSAEGAWSWSIAKDRAGAISLFRFDELAPDGSVESRIETPFEYSVLSPQVMRERRVVVQKGDVLWRIAEQFYGEGLRYSLIYGANETLIRDPDLIYPGQVFSIPELIDAQ